MSNFLQIPISWESTDQRIQEVKQEDFEMWADRTHGYIERGKRTDPRGDNVIRVLTFPEINSSGHIEMIKEFDYTHNIVTDDGDIYYAKQGAGETPAVDEDFSQSDAKFEMGSTAIVEAKGDVYSTFSAGAANPIAGSLKSYTSTYPKTNDTGDADNTGDAIDAVSYAVDYLAGDWNDTDVEQAVIIDEDVPIAATKLLTHFSFTSFAKTSSDTLKVFVNHTMNGI